MRSLRYRVGTKKWKKQWKRKNPNEYVCSTVNNKHFIEKKEESV